MPNILVIDDEAEIAELLEIQLRMAGHNVEVCSDGEEAINTLKDNQFDLVVVDLFMPKKSGLEVALFIRNELPSVSSKTPIIALTGGNGIVKSGKSAEKIDKFVNFTLQKPVNINTLNNKIEELIAA